MIEKNIFQILNKTKDNFNLKNSSLLWKENKEENSIYYRVNSKKIDEKLWIIKKEIEIFNLNNDKILREEISLYILKEIKQFSSFLATDILLIEEDNTKNEDILKILITWEYE